MVIKYRKAIAWILFSAVCLLLSVSASLNYIDVSADNKGVRLPVIMYHQLTKYESKTGKYVLTLEQFEKDLKYLKNNGYETVTIGELIEFSEGRTNIKEKSVLITFDDGNETLYEYAMPLLKKYGFTAVGFVVGALADRYTELDDHNLNYSNLNWQEIKVMSEENIIDIQSHSFDLHKNTAERSGVKKKKSETIEQYREFLSNDSAKMKMKMLEHTGKAPVAFAYPFGSYSPESEDILKENGLKAVFTCEERVNIIKKAKPECLFGLGRYNRPSGISSESFFEKMGI